MKKGTIPLLIISAIVLCLIIIVVKSYRSLSILNEEVINKESDINVQLTRKKEQIATLIKISEKYVKNEDDLFNELKKESESLNNVDIYLVRVKTGINERLIELLNELFKKYNDKALNDGEIKASVNDILATEKRIKIAADNYNKAVESYNSKINSFPSSIIAFFRGFKIENEFTISVELNDIYKNDEN